MRMLDDHMVTAPETVWWTGHSLAGHECIHVSSNRLVLPLAFATLVVGFCLLFSMVARCRVAPSSCRLLLCWRADPNGEWKRFTKDSLFARVGAARSGNFQQARFLPCG